MMFDLKQVYLNQTDSGYGGMLLRFGLYFEASWRAKLFNFLLWHFRVFLSEAIF